MKAPGSKLVSREQWGAYERMYQWFNSQLWKGQLASAILNFSRKNNTRGFFAPARWTRGQHRAHEISINPDLLQSRAPREVASTLVHEMCHLWQHDHGKPSRNGYHNAEWAREMVRVGLMPSDTGEPNGRQVGQRVTHYIVDGGPFALAYEAMPHEYLLPWLAAPEVAAKKREREAKSKTKYVCPSCDANVWGKPELQIACIACSDGGALVAFVEGD